MDQCKTAYRQDTWSPTTSLPTASECDLTPVQCFLDRCFKRKYTSKLVNAYDFLEKQDLKILLLLYYVMCGI